MTNISRSTLNATVGEAADTSGEGSTETDNTVSNATDRNNINDSTINRQTGNRNRQASRNNPTVDTSNKAFEGAEPDIGCVLGLRFVKVDKKVAYDVFCDKFANYISRSMKYGNEVVCAVKEYKDPVTDYEENNMPKDLPRGETSAAKKAILNQKVKLYVTKEAEIKDNKWKIYGKIWGQCTDALQSMIAHDKGYEEKERKKDLITLLETSKEISSGLDKLRNERVTYWNALKLLVLMRKGETESEDSHVKRVHSSIETLILAGRKGALCCSKTLMTEDKANPTEKEVNDEVDNLAAIHIIISGDAKRFDDLAKDLMQQAHLGQDLYPTSLAGALN